MPYPACSDGIIFAIGSFFNVTIDLFLPVVRPTIRLMIKSVAREMVEVDSDVECLTDSQKERRIDERFGQLGGKGLFGKTIGIVERELYIYALVYNIPQIIQGILVFKAFSGWTGPRRKDIPEHLDEQGRMLGHYYAYTLGNLVSIGLAIAFYHIAVYLYGHFIGGLMGWCR